MAVLSEGDRAAIHGSYMREEPGAHGDISKAEIRAAVNALDDWFDTNASTINQAIPLPARTTLTLAQKSRLVRYVIAKRYG